MFGFFKKKSGESPEEQERLQKAAQETARQKVSQEIPEQLRSLGQKFLPEELSILAVSMPILLALLETVKQFLA